MVYILTYIKHRKSNDMIILPFLQKSNLSTNKCLNHKRYKK